MTGATIDDAVALRVLLGLRLSSVAPADAVGARAGLTLDEARALLTALAARDLVRFRDGALTGWMLTPAGRIEGERLLAAELASMAPATADAVRQAYEQFLSHNQRLLEVCTDWQLKGGAESNVVNDHLDAEYDRRVIADLRALDGDVQPIVAGLAAVAPRFAGYGARFAEALDRVERGEGEYFTKPMIDSYHTIWFELHENFLATLGIERSAEGRS